MAAAPTKGQLEKQKLDETRAKRPQILANSKLNILCWNLEHFRGGKQLERQGKFIFSRIGLHSVSFVLEAHSKAAAKELQELLGGDYEVIAVDVGKELVLAVYKKDTIRVRERKSIDVGAVRDMAVFEVAPNGCKTVFTIGVLHAPAPNQEHMQAMIPKFFGKCAAAAIDVAIGDFNFDSAEISQLGYAEATAGFGTSTITAAGPSARPGPLDRAWYYWRTMCLERAVLLSVPDDDYATYKADVSDHLAVSLTVYRRNPPIE